MKKVAFFENVRFASTRASLLKVRCRFGGSRGRPKSAKSAPGGCQKTLLKTKSKIIKNLKKHKAAALTKCRVYHTKVSFSVFESEKIVRNIEPKSEVFWGPGPTFGLQKGGQKGDFFETTNFLKSDVLLKREHHFRRLGGPKDVKQRSQKNENKSKNRTAKK